MCRHESLHAGRIRRRARRQQTSVAGEEKFEAEVGGEVTGSRGDAVFVVFSVACENEWLRLLLPLQRFHVEIPEVPSRVRDVGRIGVEALCGEGGNFGRVCALRTQIPLRRGGFAGVDGLDDQFGEGVFRGRERRCRQKSREFRDHRFGRKVSRPDA